MAGILGNAVDILGTAFNLPEWGISEKLNSGNPTTNTVVSPVSSGYGSAQQNFPVATSSSGPPSQYYSNPSAYPLTTAALQQQGQVQGASTGWRNGDPVPKGYGVNNGQLYNLDANAGGPQGASESEINSIYAPQSDVYNQVEASLREQQPQILGEVQGQYDVNKQLATTGKTGAMNQIGVQETQGQRGKEDAMSRARRIFQEQQIGSQQRFGGSSSAGQASSELLARNLQTEQGQTQRQYNDFVQQIGVKKQEVEQKFNDTILQLNQQKDMAMNQITRDFQQKLLEIQNNRAQLESAKATAKLQALMDLRNKTYAIQQQNQQFLQQVALQKNQTLGSYDNLVNQFSQGANQSTQGAQQAGQVLSQTTGRKIAPLSMNYTPGGQTRANPYIGYAQSLGKQDDPLSSIGQISPSPRDQFSFA